MPDEFTVMRHYSERGLVAVLRAVPWGLVAPHEAQAQRNHGGQTLAWLNERGGLDSAELIAVLEDRPWRSMPADIADARIIQLRDAYLQKGAEK